jgi:hypothetical protein
LFSRDRVEFSEESQRGIRQKNFLGNEKICYIQVNIPELIKRLIRRRFVETSRILNESIEVKKHFIKK